MSRTPPKRKRYCDIRATSLEEVLETCNRHITNIGKTQADYIAEGDGTTTDDFYCDMFRQTWMDLRDDVQQLLAAQALVKKHHALSTPQPVSDVTPSVHIIEGTEYERGWGQRPDGFVAFMTEEQARHWIKNYDSTHNNLDHAPDEYTKYRYLGVRQCSLSFYNSMKVAGVWHFEQMSELNFAKIDGFS